MKKILAVLLCVLSLLSLLASCGEAPAEEPVETAPEQTAQETPVEEKTPAAPVVPKVPEKPADPRWADEVVTPEVEAIIASARAYFMHRNFIQYDQLMMDREGRVSPRYEFCSPETATSQRVVHFECGVFCRNVYLNVFDYTTPKAGVVLAEDYANEHNERPFYWSAYSENPLPKEEAKQQMIDALEPGDVIYYNYVENNHVMLYLGQGEIMHCSYPSGGGDYDYTNATDHTEATGLFTMTVDEMFAGRDLFASKNKVCLFRPLALGLTMNENAKIRTEKLQNIIITKTTSAPLGVSVSPGGEVEITISIRNMSRENKTVTITDEAPEHTTMAGGDTFPCTLEIEPSSSKKVSYKLKVDNDDSIYGQFIHVDKTKVEGMEINDTYFFVGTTLTDAQQSKIKALDVNTIGAASEDELVAKFYKQALGAEVNGFESSKVLNYVFPSFPGSASTMLEAKPDLKRPEAQCFIRTLYGGKNVTNYQENIYPRTRGVHEYNLVPGDVIMYSKDGTIGTCRTFIYVGDNRAISVADGKIEESALDNVLDRLFGQFCFCVIRPSLNF